MRRVVSHADGRCRESRRLLSTKDDRPRFVLVSVKSPRFSAREPVRGRWWLTCRIAHTSTITGPLSPDLCTGHARPALTFNSHFKILSPE